ncbi:LANO_0F05402g1_1 [Lachancea nothofagi CBS 11611]|uniref:LANO_0F05402g1_1 n=1 Tax=Lachancea nothofagi CBS 11611 TaxID=1266666 RepID=A0A1G4K816_9SACH|nr:LANO_0F05402g1_1 [Lachancea nothofagi CBS 11611]
MSLSRVSSHDEQGSSIGRNGKLSGGGGNAVINNSSVSGSGIGGVRPVDIVVANHDFITSKKSQLRLYAGDVVYVLGKHESGWWDGIVVGSRSAQRCTRGWFPQNFTRAYRDRRHATLQPNSGKSSNTTGLGQRQSNRSGGSSRRSSITAIHFAFGPGNQVQGSGPSNNHRLGTVSEPNLSPSASQTSLSPHLKEDYRFDMRSGAQGTKSSSRRPSQASPAASVTRSASGSTSNSAGGKSRSKSPCRSPAPGYTSAADDQQEDIHRQQQQQLQQQQNHSQIDPLQKISSFEDDRRRRSQVGTDKMNVLSSDEVEMIFNNINDNSPPIWTPVATTEGKVVYYNRDYDIYCNTLPFLQTPELNIKSVFSDHDWYVDLSERSLGKDKRIFDSSRKNSTEPPGSNLSDSRISSVAPNSLNNFRVSQGSRRSSIDEKSKSFIAAALLSEAGAGTGKEGERNNAKSQSEDGGGKRNGTENEINSGNNNDIWSKGQASTLLSKEELFFHHRSDIRSWTELRDTTLFFARKAYASFFRNDYHEFNQNFEITSKFTIYYHNACRLLKGELVRNNAKRDVKRLLKRMTASTSAVSLNGNLYFCSPQRFDISFLPSSPQPHKSSVTSTGTAVHDPVRISVSTLNPLNKGTPKLSIGNSDFYLTDDAQGQPDAEKNGDRNDRLGSVMSSYTIQAHSSAVDENSNISIQSLFQSIDSEFSLFMKCIRDLHAIMVSNSSSGGVLPQLFTRFFRDCFSGGAWTSTFQDNFTDLTARNSVLGFGSLQDPYSVTTTNPFGSVSSKPTIEGSILSKGSAENEKLSSQRALAKTKSSTKPRYPLTDNTLTFMKKQIDYFTSTSFQSYETLLEERPSKKRNLEISTACHRELSHSVTVIETLENLDLRFFLNMKNLGYKTELDEDSEELRQHAMTACAPLLMEFFDVKQALYDVTIKKIMDIQNLTLSDPFVFCAMAGDQSFADERDENSKVPNTLKLERLADAYCKRLISDDVEINNLSFLDTDLELKATQASFLRIIGAAYQIVEQLMQERESILNYAARMMKNDLITELMKGEQDKWYAGSEGKFADSEIEHIGPQDFDKSFSIDVPWFLDSEHEYSLIYDNQGCIKGGSKAALLEHSTSHLKIDAPFNISMLLTFRSIFTTSEFLHALVERYHLYPPEGLSFEEYSTWIDKKSNPVKARVVNIMKTLFSHYWTPAYYEPGIDDLISFAQLATAQNVSGAPALLIELKNRLSLKGNLKNFVPETIKFDESGHNYGGNALNPKVATGSSIESGTGYGFRMRKLKLLDIDPQTFAKQLTTKEHFLYSKITPFACFDRIWGKKYCKFGGSEDISKFISSANTLTNYVSFAIVKQSNIKKRARIIQHFISIAEHAYELNNFSSMTAIISALYSSPIFRLKRSWSLVPAGSKKILENLNTLMDPAKNFLTYRSWLKSVKDVACVPFFGVYLSDLTFIAQGNPDFLHRSADIINFGKRVRIVEILKEVASYQNIRYKVKRYDDVQAFIEESIKNVPNIEKQYEQSLRVEPRTDASAGLNSTNAVSKADIGKKLEKRSRFVKNRKRATKLIG